MKPSFSTDLQPVVSRLSSSATLTSEAQRAILDLPAIVLSVPAKRDVDWLRVRPDYSCFVSSGLIARYRQLPDGERQITAFHIPGDISDLHSAVLPTTYGGLYSVSDSILVCIPYADIRKLAAAFPSIGEALWQECALDMGVMAEWIVNLGRRDATARAAHLFCEMAMRFGNRQEPLLDFSFPITQEDLASALGITGVHLNRVLKGLKLTGLLAMQNKRVYISNWLALSALCDFDAMYLQPQTGKQRLKC